MHTNSEEFKENVMSLYGGKDVLLKESTSLGTMVIEGLKAGDKSVGNLLFSISQERFSDEAVIEAIAEQNYQKLYQEAKRKLEARQLYNEWRKHYELSYSRFFEELPENKMNR